MNALESGLSVRQIAESAFNAFRNALGHKDHWGRPIPGWKDIDFAAQEGWIEATGEAIDYIDPAESLPWLSLAAWVYDHWACVMGYSSIPFDNAYPETKLAWVAAVKHIANLLALEDPSDLKEHEDRWLNYSRSELSKEVG